MLVLKDFHWQALLVSAFSKYNDMYILYIDVKIVNHVLAGGVGEEQPRDLLRVSARPQVPSGRGPGGWLCPGKYILIFTSSNWWSVVVV